MKIEIFIRNDGELCVQAYKNGSTHLFLGKSAEKVIARLSKCKKITVINKDNKVINFKCDEVDVSMIRYKRIKYSKKLIKVFKNLVEEMINLDTKEKEKITTYSKLQKRKEYLSKLSFALSLAALVGAGANVAVESLNSEDTQIEEYSDERRHEIPKLKSIAKTDEELEEEFLDSIIEEQEKEKYLDNMCPCYDEEKEESYGEISSMTIEIPCGSRHDEYKKVPSEYKKMVYEIAPKYGIDPQLFIALVCTESNWRNILDPNKPAIGVSQIEKSVWMNKPITAYNVITGENETIVATYENLSNIKTNIDIGCKILSRYMNEAKENIPLGLLFYNAGIGGAKGILYNYMAMNNYDIYDLINRPSNIEWLNYIHNRYNQTVFSLLEDGTVLEFKLKNGEIYFYTVKNVEKVKEKVKTN